MRGCCSAGHKVNCKMNANYIDVYCFRNDLNNMTTDYYCKPCFKLMSKTFVPDNSVVFKDIYQGLRELYLFFDDFLDLDIYTFYFAHIR